MNREVKVKNPAYVKGWKKICRSDELKKWWEGGRKKAARLHGMQIINAQCLKITQKVSFNIVSEAKFTFWVDKSSLKMPKIVNFGEFFKTFNLRSNSVTRQVTFNRTKIEKFVCDILSNFQTLCSSRKIQIRIWKKFKFVE